MNKQTNKLIPELRFPEFLKDGEWSERKLEEIGEFIGGGTPDTTNEEFWNGEIQWYTPTEVKDGILNTSKRKITELGLKNSSAKLLPKGTILITTRATIGDVAITNEECTTNQGFHSLVVNNSEINSFWFYWIIKNKDEFIRKSSGSTFKEIGKNEIINITSFSPKNPTEQQRIASCLSSLDELITAHANKLETLKTYKKGLMQNLFPQDGGKVPKLRFKEFEKDGDWENTEIENYIDLFSGIAFKSEEISDDRSGIPILRGINITEGYIRHSKDIDKFYIGDLENLKKYLIKENDIVIGMDGSKVGKNVALIRNEDENSILIQRVARIRTNKKTYFKYIYQHFISEKFRNYVDRVNTSSGIPHISSQQIKNFKIGFPPKMEEQQKIAETLSTLDDLITEQVDKIEQLKLHKKGLMQGLFPKVKG